MGFGRCRFAQSIRTTLRHVSLARKLARPAAPSYGLLSHDWSVAIFRRGLAKGQLSVKSCHFTLLTQFAYFDIVQCFVTICIVKSVI